MSNQLDDLNELLSTLYKREEDSEERLVALAERYMKDDIKTLENLVTTFKNRLNHLESVHAKLEERRQQSFERQRQVLINKIKKLDLSDNDNVLTTVENKNDQNDIVDTKTLQALSYTVFDTILFSITKGSAPDFTLISQSALFETVYINISRGYDSYLFSEVPASAKVAIIQGRSILEELRDREERFLDEPDLWDIYAPQIQDWWINCALPLIFGERDPDWDNTVLPTYDEMQRWKSNEFSQRQFFPAIMDLIELAKDKASIVASSFNFNELLSV